MEDTNHRSVGACSMALAFQRNLRKHIQRDPIGMVCYLLYLWVEEILSRRLRIE
jgi:hypothetical protein